MYQKICPNCNKEIEFRYFSDYKKYKFCDNKCWHEFMRGKNNPNPAKDKIRLKCKTCEKDILISGWELKMRPNLKYCSPKCRGRDKKWRKTMSDILIINGSHKMERNGNWRNGKSFEPYSPEFDENRKEKIRIRDNFICQLCGIKQSEHLNKFGDRLYIHHIDYDKKNCNENNLITLCQRDNSIVNFKREDWIKYFKVKIKHILATKQS